MILDHRKVYDLDGKSINGGNIMRSQHNLSLSVLIVFTLILSACGRTALTPTAPPVGDKIQIDSINEGSIHPTQITQQKVFDQCQSASPLQAQISFSEAVSEESEDALMLGAEVGGKAQVSGVAEVEIKGQIQKHFTEKRGNTQEHTESIQIEVPPYTKQEYTIIWTEYRQEGTVNYIENSEDLSIGFTYRIGGELSSSSVRDLSCTSSTPISILPGGDWQQSCISTNWTIYPVSETTVDESGCYQQPI